MEIEDNQIINKKNNEEFYKKESMKENIIKDNNIDINNNNNENKKEIDNDNFINDFVNISLEDINSEDINKDNKDLKSNKDNEIKYDESTSNSEINKFSIDSYLNEKDKKDKENKINKNKKNINFGKRQTMPLDLGKTLKNHSISLDDDNIKKEKNKNKPITIERSYSQAIMPTKSDLSKKSFYNELSEDPKYQKIIDLKEETENALKKTVENKGNSGFVRSLVSRKKARFCYDGFDLDLTYITMRIIAMGLPSTSIEGLYRNNMEDVKRFFNKRHPKHHKVYNLCEEKNYPKNSFYQQGYYPFPDHEAPPLNSLMPFCEDAKEFLDESEQNVVAIHCKAGKGRTGTFICCLLLYLGIFDTADECMKYYGLMRVGAEKGVTIPSQKRYVNYFECIIKNKIPTPLTYKSVCIKSLKIYTIPNFSKFGASCTPTFTIKNGSKVLKYSEYQKKKTYDCLSYKSISFPLNIPGFSVAGDVLITFYHIQFFGNAKMFKFWFNTNFLPQKGILEIEKKNLDKAFKDKENKLFSPDFKVEMEYSFL